MTVKILAALNKVALSWDFKYDVNLQHENEALE